MIDGLNIRKLVSIELLPIVYVLLANNIKEELIILILDKATQMEPEADNERLIELTLRLHDNWIFS